MYSQWYRKEKAGELQEMKNLSAESAPGDLHVGIDPPEHSRRKRNLGKPVSLRDQSRLSCVNFIEAPANDRQLGFMTGAVQASQRLII